MSTEAEKKSVQIKYTEEKELSEFIAKMVIENLEKKNFVFSEEIKSTIRTIANALIVLKKMVIITGKPGTGKTVIAEEFAKSASGEFINFIESYDMTTATSNWTSYETVGGYALTEKNKLDFQEGLIFDALKNKKWLIIDEINRADIDKAFGIFFTILSGQDVKLFEKYSDSYENVEVEGFDSSDPEQKFRIIGTMNTSDKASLYQVSFAFKRRFLFFDIEYEFDDIEKIRDKTIEKLSFSAEEIEIIKKLSELWDSSKFEGLPLGPAILIDFLKSIDSIKNIGIVSLGNYYSIDQSFITHVIYYLEYLNDDEIAKIEALINEDIIKNNLPKTHKKISSILKEIL